MGKVVLSKLVGMDTGHRGQVIDCGQGDQAAFVNYRVKQVTTVVGSVSVRRMMARVGAKESFDEGREDLEALANVIVTAKDVERVSEEIGAKIDVDTCRETIPDNVVPFLPINGRLYIGIDGTGVPVVKRETFGRVGKGSDGIAKTREAKLGAIFTQAGTDKNGHPVRDENTTTYVGAIETSEEFSKRIYAEAVRRGLHRATELVKLF